MPSKHSKMQRSLLQAVSRQRRKSCWQCLPMIRFKIHRLSKNWSEILPVLTHAASIFSTISCMKSLQKKEPFAFYLCGRIMNEQAHYSVVQIDELLAALNPDNIIRTIYIGHINRKRLSKDTRLLNRTEVFFGKNVRYT